MSWGDWGFIDAPEVVWRLTMPHRTAMAWDEWADKIKHRTLNPDMDYHQYEITHPPDKSFGSFLTYMEDNPNKKLNIELLQTHPNFERRGVGEALIRRMHEDYPGYKIVTGPMTDQGRAFHDRLMERVPTAKDWITARLGMAWQDYYDKIQHDVEEDHGWGDPPSASYHIPEIDSGLEYHYDPNDKINKIYVDWLYTDPDHRNDGVAEAFFRRMHQDHPNHHIVPGEMTNEGQAFHDRMLQKEPTARDLVTARLAALNNDLVDRIRGEFDDWWFSPKNESSGRSEGLSYWPNIEDFLQDKYPAAYKGLDMGREQAKPALDTGPDASCPRCNGSGLEEEAWSPEGCLGCDGSGKIDPGRVYETGPSAVAKHGYDPKEIAAGMLLLHNESHGRRRNYLEEDTNRLMDIAQKRFKMQREYESRTARRLFLAMAWEDWKDNIKGGCDEGCAHNGTYGRYVIPQAGAFLDFSHAWHRGREEPQLWISGIYTHPQNRNDGVAEALMRRLAEDHPGIPIKPGIMTNDGQNFHDRMLQKEPTARDLVTAANHIVAMAWDEWAPKIRRQTSDGHSDEDFCVNGDCSSFDWRHEGRGMRYEIEHDDGAWSALDYGHYADSQNNPYVAVHMIRTHPDYRKDGIAEAFMRRLVDDHPGIRIDPGDMSIDGKAFHDRMLEKEPTARDLVM